MLRNRLTGVTFQDSSTKYAIGSNGGNPTNQAVAHLPHPIRRIMRLKYRARNT